MLRYVNLPIVASRDMKDSQDEDGDGRPVKGDDGGEGRYEFEYGR